MSERRLRGVRDASAVPRSARPGRAHGSELSRAPGGGSSSDCRRRARSGSRRPARICALRVEGRTWINSDGKHNMPSGEVFTGPLEDSANGTIRFTIPSSPRGVEVGRHAADVRGRACRRGDARSAARTTCRRRSRHDAGARFLGEIGIGTNAGIDRPTGSILLDEKMAGTVHLALGRSYPETGGTNALRAALGHDLRPSRRRPTSVDGETLPLTARLTSPNSRCSSFQGNYAPHEDRRHHRTGVSRARDAHAHGRGRASTWPA